MKVTTVRLPDDLAEAVEEAADDTERSQSEYIRHVLRTHFDTEPNTPPREGDDRVDELVKRVEALEERVDTPTPDTGGGGRAPQPEAATGDGGAGELDEAAIRAAVREAIGDGAPRKTHARDALVDTVALIADRGDLATGDLKDELHPRFDEEYSTKKTMWNSLARHLEELPGVYKPEYGTWGVDVDALVEGEGRAI